MSLRSPTLRSGVTVVVAFIAIAALVLVPRIPFIHQGLAFNDASWMFHYGHRVLNGAVPYRDFVFQVGPLPIYVDAGFQAIFGAKLVASLYAAAAIHVVRVLAVWAVARRLAGARTAAALCVFCSFDLSFGWAHHWSWAYAQLFITTGALGFVVASRAATERRRLFGLVLAGSSAGFILASRQASAVMIVALLLVASVALLARGRLSRREMLAIWGGVAAGIAIVLLALVCLGALGPAIQQMLLDAPEKKGAGSIRAVLDAVSGGALVLPGATWGQGVIQYLVLPMAGVSMVMRLLRQRDNATVSVGSVGMLLVPGFIVLGLFLQYAKIEISDLVRMFFSVTIAVTVQDPSRCQRWFGIEPLLVVGLTGLPLASEWAMEMSFPGRGWTDHGSLVVGAILFLLASARVANGIKFGVCVAFAACGLVHFGWFLQADRQPFALPGPDDGTRSLARFTSSEPVLEGLRMSEPRQRTVAWLSSQVPAGSTCFLYGTDSALYDVLRCKNPTRIDTTIPDFITVRDAQQALSALQDAPPDFIISQETSLGNVPLTEADARWPIWKELNQPAGILMHDGLRKMLGNYEDIGLAADVLGPALAEQAAHIWDNLQSIRLYRRKR